MLVRALVILLLSVCYALAWGGQHVKARTAPPAPRSGFRSHREQLDAAEAIARRQVKADDLRKGRKRQDCSMPVPSTQSCSCAGTTYCSGVCVDTTTDNNNCGSCGNQCTGGQTCSGGICGCVSGDPSCITPTIFNLVDNFIGTDFFSGFVWENIPDPTDGTVNYVDQPTAISLNLSYATDDTFIMRADDTTVLPASGTTNRNSVRIKTVNTYTTGVYVLDLTHMPDGCATWPSWWTTYEVGWPATGEIDIIEYINGVSPNRMTLHTNYDPPGPSCVMPTVTSAEQTGDQVDFNCEGSDGCTMTSAFSNSAGSSFNAIGGGWFVMERTLDAISIWFWPRNSGSVPADISGAAAQVNTALFGEPDAYFPSGTWCPFDDLFAPHNVIFDLTLCGQYAGPNYPSTCPGVGTGWDACNNYVWTTPSGFSEAYWEISRMSVYE